MPIRINLLAEAQAAEEMHRRDPVKRGIWIGGFLVCLVGLWIAKLQLDIIFENANIRRLEDNWQKVEGGYKEAIETQKKSLDVEARLLALDRLSTNRFLWGNVFDALQQTTVDNIQVTHIRTDQTYFFTEGKAGDKSKRIAAQPATMTEKTTLIIEAKDWNPVAETSRKFKETLNNFDFFLKRLRRRDGFVFNGTLSAPVPDLQDSSRQSVFFTLEARFPEEVRSNE